MSFSKNDLTGDYFWIGILAVVRLVYAWGVGNGRKGKSVSA